MKQKFQMPDGEIREQDIPMWKTPYNHDREFESDRTGLYCKDPSLTKQEFKEETDINVILERFTRSGEPPPMVLPEHFMDLTERTNYFDMSRQIAEANKNFYLLPAALRANFQNDPTRWADAVVQAVHLGDREYLEELGIEAPPKPLAAEQAKPGATPAPETKKPSEAPKGAPKTDSDEK